VSLVDGVPRDQTGRQVTPPDGAHKSVPREKEEAVVLLVVIVALCLAAGLAAAVAESARRTSVR